MRKQMRIAALVLLSTAVPHPAISSGPGCDALNEATKDLEWHRPYIAQVSGEGRAHFYSAPAAECRTQQFIIPKDKVTTYNDHGSYSLISFDAKGQHFDAWVRTDRLSIIARPDEPPESPAARAAKDPATKLKAGQPEPVKALLDRIVECNHWGGEEPYDRERAKEINDAVAGLRCERIEADEKALLKKYRDRPGVNETLAAAHDCCL